MLKSIHLENFFSFKDTKIEFHKNENILIGINGSGKSNLLKAIQFLKEGVAGIGLTKLISDTWGGFDSICFCGGEKKSDIISLTYELDANAINNFGYDFKDNVFYEIIINRMPGFDNYYISYECLSQRKISPKTKKIDDFYFLKFENGKGVIYGKKDLPNNQMVKPTLIFSKEVFYSNFNPQELALYQVNDPDRFLIQYAIREAVREIIVYNYIDTTPYSSIRKPMKPSGEKRLLSDGANLPQVLNTIKINYRRNYQMMIEMLDQINEKFKGFEFHPIGGNIELMLEESGLSRLLHVTHISDGTLRFLCMLSIFYNPDRGKLICIDEPEVGLHPDMILNIANAVKDASTDSQFIIATHSENVLNSFDLENIRVFEKNPQNETTVQSFSNEEFRDWYNEFSPGKMWRAGDLGGNRW